MVTCQEIEANPQQYANQEITVAGTVQTGQVLPQGVWLILNDGTASLWVWSSEQLDGNYYLSGTVCDNYLVLSGASQIEESPQPPAEVQEEPQQAQAPAAVAAYGMAQANAAVVERAQAQAVEYAQQEEGGAPLLKPVVVAASSLAYGFGLYSLTLSFPPSAKTSIFYALPVVALLLGFAPWLAVKKIGSGKGLVPRADDMWKLYPPLIVSAFLALYLSPEVVAESVSPEFAASIKKVFLISLAPLLLSLVLQFANTGKYEQDAKNRLAISLISVAIIGIPLLVLYPLLTGTL